MRMRPSPLLLAVPLMLAVGCTSGAEPVDTAVECELIDTPGSGCVPGAVACSDVHDEVVVWVEEAFELMGIAERTEVLAYRVSNFQDDGMETLTVHVRYEDDWFVVSSGVSVPEYSFDDKQSVQMLTAQMYEGLRENRVSISREQAEEALVACDPRMMLTDCADLSWLFGPQADNTIPRADGECGAVEATVDLASGESSCEVLDYGFNCPEPEFGDDGS